MEQLLPPLPDPLRVGTTDVQVGALNVGQLMRVVQLFKGGKLDQLPADGDLLVWIEKLPDEMIELALIATGMRREDLEAASVEEFVTLLAAILEKNRDFFFRTLGPALRVLLSRVALVAGMLDGLIPSSSLSSTATGSPRSSGTPSGSSSAS